MSSQEVAEPFAIIVCFTRGGELAHALDFDDKTVLGPWVKFASADTLERALLYLWATEEQVEAHRHTMRQTGQGSSHIRLLPNRKNLLRIDLGQALSRKPPSDSQVAGSRWCGWYLAIANTASCWFYSPKGQCGMGASPNPSAVGTASTSRPCGSRPEAAAKDTKAQSGHRRLLQAFLQAPNVSLRSD